MMTIEFRGYQLHVIPTTLLQILLKQTFTLEILFNTVILEAGTLHSLSIASKICKGHF